MRSLLHVSPDESAPGTGGGPEDDPRGPRRAVRSQGLLTLAFGLALGVALMVLFGLIDWWDPGSMAAMLPSINVWQIFLAGLIGGTLIAGIYNLLVVRRLNLFSLESALD